MYSWWINPYLYEAMSADGGDPKIDKEDGSIRIEIGEGIGYNKNRPWAMDGAFQLYLGRPTTRASKNRPRLPIPRTCGVKVA